MLSDRGRELLPQALELMERAESFGDIGNTNRTQALAIGATRSIGPHLLPRLISDFEKHLIEEPLVAEPLSADKTDELGRASSAKIGAKRHYELFVQNSEAVLSRLGERSLDMALVEGDVLDPALQKQTWLSDQLVIFCRAGHPLLSQKQRLKSLHAGAWALRESGSGTREIFLRALAPILPTLNIEVQTTDNLTLSEIVASSDRLGCLSRRVIENELQSGKLVEIHAHEIAPGLEQRLIRSLWIVTHPLRHQRALLAKLIGFTKRWDKT
jgi:DNA-binding transcriptional LysR family regulator